MTASDDREALRCDGPCAHRHCCWCERIVREGEVSYLVGVRGDLCCSDCCKQDLAHLDAQQAAPGNYQTTQEAIAAWNRRAHLGAGERKPASEEEIDAATGPLYQFLVDGSPWYPPVEVWRAAEVFHGIAAQGDKPEKGGGDGR